LRRLFIIVESAVLLVGLLCSYLLARRCTTPILRMAKMAESIASGGLRDARMVVESRDEIGKLGEAFNRMTHELAHSYAILEDRVTERTAELAHVNEALREQIAERLRAERELDRYFTLALDLFCIADYKGFFKRLNPAWERVVGHTPPELMAKPFIEFVHPDDREATAAEFHKILAGAHTLQFENRYRCKDGSYRWLQWTATPVADEQLIVAVARDVTEHRRAQQLLTQFADVLNRKNLEFQEDLKMAREVQQAFIPQHYPTFPRAATAETSALRFWHVYLPTSGLGGDFFDVLPLSDTEAGVFICDVMGHGMRAALLTAVIRGLVDELRSFAADPGQFLTEINLALTGILRGVSTPIFASACYVVVDAATGRMLCANAGHPTPLHVQAESGRVERLTVAETVRGTALGLTRDCIYATASHNLNAGDAVLLFTDGLYEAENHEGEQFGHDRLEAAVRTHIHLPRQRMLDAALADVRKFAAGGEFSDDVCAVGIEFAEHVAARPTGKEAYRAAS
jgi:sigma-B regulation protein RsbU (phosphoserine phosphatase)